MVTGYRAGTYVAPTLTYTGATCTHPSKDEYKMFWHWTATGGIYDDVGSHYDIAPVSVFGRQRTFTSLTTLGPTDASPTTGNPWLTRIVAPLGKGKDIMMSRSIARGTATSLPEVPISCPPH